MKWPRQYAAEILVLESREERKAALERVPEQYQAMVRRLVEIYFERRRRRAENPE